MAFELKPYDFEDWSFGDTDIDLEAVFRRELREFYGSLRFQVYLTKGFGEHDADEYYLRLAFYAGDPKETDAVSEHKFPLSDLKAACDADLMYADEQMAFSRREEEARQHRKQAIARAKAAQQGQENP